MVMKKRVADKMLQAVLADPGLQKFGGLAPADVDGLSVDAAVVSENAVVHAVGVIIERIGDECSEREVYNEVNEYLKNNI
jgi:hypothetical protein